MKIDINRMMVEVGLEKLTTDLRSKLVVAEAYSVIFTDELVIDKVSINQLIFDIYTIQTKILDLGNKCYVYNYQDLIAEVNQINHICHDYSRKLRMMNCK